MVLGSRSSGCSVGSFMEFQVYLAVPISSPRCMILYYMVPVSGKNWGRVLYKFERERNANIVQIKKDIFIRMGRRQQNYWTIFLWDGRWLHFRMQEIMEQPL